MDIELKVSNLSELICPKISINERGVLITLLLVKKPDDCSEILWARFKQITKISSEVRDSLVLLSDRGYLEWSGTKAAKIAQQKELFTDDVKEVIRFANKTWGTKRQVTESLAKVILPRLQEHKLKDLKLVISNRYSVWKDDPTMRKYLVLETVLRPSLFSKYFDEAIQTREGSSVVINEQFNLTKGSKLTPEVLEAIIDSEIYPVREYSTSPEGEPIGIPRILSKSGKEIRSYLNKYKREQARGNRVEAILQYWPVN